MRDAAITTDRPRAGVIAEAREVAAYVRSLAARIDQEHGRIVGDYARRAARDLEDLVGALEDEDAEVRARR